MHKKPRTISEEGRERMREAGRRNGQYLKNLPPEERKAFSRKGSEARVKKYQLMKELLAEFKGILHEHDL